VLAGGEVAVPQGPGLGIELDRDVLAAMLVR
jgi:L-alanine-DL-glutamate epimerase-like enolase superfamily enzyme